MEEERGERGGEKRGREMIGEIGEMGERSGRVKERGRERKGRGQGEKRGRKGEECEEYIHIIMTERAEYINTQMMSMCVSVST